MDASKSYPPSDADRAAARTAHADEALGAVIAAVEPDSPAYDAGFEPGCAVLTVDGHPIRDIIDWRWHAAECEITVGYRDLEGDCGEVDLWREPGEDWGIEFQGLVYDGVRQCRNACTFCFMRMLPKDMRPSLYVRDDDYRLSFLVGTFVTLTNIRPEDEARICEQKISPLRVSLQASNPEVRRKMIGAHAQQGIDVLDRLLDAGIAFHAQIVLVPGQNDGAVLEETLSWAYRRPGILNIGIVPLGFTAHQHVFAESFDDPVRAKSVLELVEPFQCKALRERGHAWVFPADEFYRNAYLDQLLEKLPDSGFYGAYDMFEDGIGIIRSTVDDWRAADLDGTIGRCADTLRKAGTRLRMVVGYAQRDFLEPLSRESDIADIFVPLYVENRFFGGNVDVTGLLVGADIVDALNEAASHDEGRNSRFFIPRVVFNDDGVTLDGMTLEDMRKASGLDLRMVSCSPRRYFEEVFAYANPR